MKISKSLVAVAVASLFAGGAVAGEGEKDKSGSMGPSFDTLDTNRDGRISQTEASADASLVFTSADMNGDGYLDKSEWKSRDKSHTGSQQQSMPQSTEQGSETVPSTSPDGTTSPDSTTPPASDVPSTTSPQPDTETPRQ
jgi:hypothetical protein